MARGKSKNRSSSNSNSGGNEGGRSERKGGDESRGGGSKSGSRNDQRSAGGGGGKRKDVRNARSLADVLSGNRGKGGGPSGSGRGGAPSSSGSGRGVGRDSRPDRGGEGDQQEDRRHSFNRPAGSDSGEDRSSNSKGPTSKKLTYIMTFQSPEERKANAQTEDPVVARAEVTRPAGEGKRGGGGSSRTQRQGPARPEGAWPDKHAREGRAQRDEQPSRGEERPQREERPPREERPQREERPKQRNQGDNRPQKKNNRGGAVVEEPKVRAKQRSGSMWPQERNTVANSAGAKPANELGLTGRRPTDRVGARHVTGFIKRHPDGFGFLIPDQPDTPDVYVARQSMTGIMTNDKVEVELYTPRSGSKNGRRGAENSKEERLSGEIVKVLSRANSRVVGRYLPVDKKYGILQDENRGWGADLRIAAADSMNAKEGELIAVEITQYPDDEHEFTGRVVSVIGDSDDPINDVIRVVHQAGIPNEFSKQAVLDAQKFGGKVTDQERRGREDLTKLPLITIDGVTAKDFDDAIHTEQTARGFHLTVAIADVSHYVKPGTQLDEDAYERGTSTYFPNYVVPMLPEELSNELCSLKPNVIRLCFCCEMNINFNGELQDFRFFEGVMQSQARVTYGEAQELIDAYDAGEEQTNKTARKLEHVSENILRSRDLAKVLMAKRFRDGSLDLEIPETQVVVNAAGESTDIIRASRIFAHRLIEELMLVTNICTARFMDESNIAGIYRIHEEPDEDKIRDLQRFLWNMGGTKTVGGANLAKKLTAALESMAGKPEAQVLNILTLRTMQQAHYSEQNVGHFGLGFSHYSHFTSPIRRYPDLIAHRIIKSALYDKYENMRMEEDEIASATTWLSACEQRSTKAERKVISIKKARFIKTFEGEEFDGMISSVAKFGVFVLLRKYDVDGLVKIENLGNDRFEFDEENLVLRGRRSGLKFGIGDEVRIRVVSADTDSGKVDFELADAPDSEGDGEAVATNENDEFGDPKGQKKRGARRTPKDQAKAGKEKRQKTFAKREEPKSEKRGSGKNDRSGVRKERVSKRRGKN